MAISHPIMLLFVAHLFGVPLGTGQIVVFAGTIFLMSFTVPGIPAVDAVPDIFKTITNVTGDMSAAAIVTRGAGL